MIAHTPTGNTCREGERLWDAARRSSEPYQGESRFDKVRNLASVWVETRGSGEDEYET